LPSIVPFAILCGMSASQERVQLHLVHPYNIELCHHHTIKSYLDRGYRILQLQRVTDREILVTVTNEPS